MCPFERKTPIPRHRLAPSATKWSTTQKSTSVDSPPPTSMMDAAQLPAEQYLLTYLLPFIWRLHSGVASGLFCARTLLVDAELADSRKARIAGSSRKGCIRILGRVTCAGRSKPLTPISTCSGVTSTFRVPWIASQIVNPPDQLEF